MTATMASTTRWGRSLKMATPMVVAITTWTKKAPAAPSQTWSGRPLVAITRLANMVLSGSSPRKMIGKTASTNQGIHGGILVGPTHSGRSPARPAPRQWARVKWAEGWSSARMGRRKLDLRPIRRPAPFSRHDAPLRRGESPPHAAEIDRTAEFPWESFKACVEMELPALGIPEAYGGAGADMVTQAIMAEELARVCASTSLTMLISKLGMLPIMNWGSEELKERYLPRVAAGEIQASYCLSEADAGSDVAAMGSRAVRDGDDYILTGSKYLDHQCRDLRRLYRLCQDRPDARGRGISCFVVERDSGDLHCQARGQAGPAGQSDR